MTAIWNARQADAIASLCTPGIVAVCLQSATSSRLPDLRPRRGDEVVGLSGTLSSF